MMQGERRKRLLSILYATAAAAALSGCAVLELLRPEGTRIPIRFSSAAPFRDTFGQHQLSFSIVTPYVGSAADLPPPEGSFDGSYPGFAVYEPIDRADGIWHLARVAAISAAPGDTVSHLQMPADLYGPPKHLGIGANVAVRERKVYFTVALVGPNSDVLDTLARYACSELALVTLVTKEGHARFDHLVPLTTSPKGPACVSRELDAQRGL